MAEGGFGRVTFLVSACLLGLNCKYSGGNNRAPALLARMARHTLIPVCPEQLGGLPTPRTPAERREGRVVTEDGRDVTAQYEKGAAEALRLARLYHVDGAILKSRSPSCGRGEIYDGNFSHTVVPGDGVAAQALAAAGYPVYTEETLPPEL